MSLAADSIVLVRHAAALGQEAESPLSAEGQRQALKLVEVLAPLGIERIVSSPFRRALDSVRPFARSSGLVVEADARLTERVLSGSSTPDWREHLSRSFADLDYCLEGVESSRTAQERGVAAVRSAAVLGAAAGQRCAIVTHGNLLALLLKWVDPSVGYDVWARLSNPDVFVIQTDGVEAKAFRRIWSA